MIIDATELSTGVYTLTFESFDKNSIAKSALKTETIEITIEESKLPEFTSDLVYETITVGKVSSWELPLIKEGSYPLQSIVVDSKYPQIITYNENDNTVSYSGSE